MINDTHIVVKSLTIIARTDTCPQARWETVVHLDNEAGTLIINKNHPRPNAKRLAAIFESHFAGAGA